MHFNGDLGKEKKNHPIIPIMCWAGKISHSFSSKNSQISKPSAIARVWPQRYDQTASTWGTTESTQGRFPFVFACPWRHVPSCSFSGWSWISRVRKNLFKQGLSSLLTNFVHFSQPSDISRFKNTLQEYKMYRDFLYQLSPKEWQEEHGKKDIKEKDLKTTHKANEESASHPTTAEQGECQGKATHSSLGQLHALSVHLFLSPGQGLTARTNTASPYSTSYIDVPSSLLSSKSLDFRSLHEIRPQLKNFLKPLSTRKL